MAVHRNRTLLFQLDSQSKTPLYRQIYDQVRRAILSGTLVEGDRLPSIRRASADAGVAHTTVEQAYLQLALEGYVRNVPRSGYRVEHFDASFLRTSPVDTANDLHAALAPRQRDAFTQENTRAQSARYDFSYANLQPDSFPVRTWRKLTDDALYASTAPWLARYGFTDKPGTLSVVLARYLAQARGVSCIPEQVLPQAGTDGALATVFQLFDHEQHLIAMEEPGYATVHEVAKRMGYRIAGLPVDQGVDAYFAALEERKPKIVFATPSHQFPTGRVMGLDMRIRLLKWAEKNYAYIIEDDSCNEYRYGTSPIPSLQSLDAQRRVVYLNNVSKVLSPALRIAYLVLPPKLLNRYLRTFAYAHPPVSALQQEVLARFISEGYWEQHVRRTATGNRKRHDALLSSLESEFGDRIELAGINSGMHLFATVKNSMSQDGLLESAARQGAAVYGTKRMWFSRPAPENKLLIGFSAIAIEDIAPGVAALRRAWFPSSDR